MAVIEYAGTDSNSRNKKRGFLVILFACMSLTLCFFASFPAMDTGQWLERARHYNLDPALIAQVEKGQPENIALAAAAWMVTGAGWTAYLFWRSRTRQK